MTKAAFDKIKAGLGEARAYLEGSGNKRSYRIHVPARVNVKKIRTQLGLSQQSFAQTYGFACRPCVIGSRAAASQNVARVSFLGLSKRNRRRSRGPWRKPLKHPRGAHVNDYAALREYLKKQTVPEFVLSFEQIEQILDAALPRAAHRASWWETLRSPQEKMPQREACLAAGYIATRLADGRRVRFKRMPNDARRPRERGDP